MAFATANVNKSYFGNLKVTAGDWTGSVGDAPGTLAVEGGRVYLAVFDQKLASGSAQQPRVETSESGTTGVSTITVNNQAAVTAGRFIVISA